MRLPSGRLTIASSAAAGIPVVQVESILGRRRRSRVGRAHARRRLGGAAGNSHLTALTAIVLLVLLAVEGATLVSLQTFLSWHIFVGMLLVPIVGLKIATTGYRFVRYYANRAEYVAAGPPPILLRLLGPVVVLSTLALFATGVALVVIGPGAPLVLGLHKASFAVWVGAMALHVLAHLLRVRELVAGQFHGDGAGASGLRLGLLAAVVVTGAILATATYSLAAPWLQWLHSAG